MEIKILEENLIYGHPEIIEFKDSKISGIFGGMKVSREDDYLVFEFYCRFYNDGLFFLKELEDLPTFSIRNIFPGIESCIERDSLMSLIDSIEIEVPKDKINHIGNFRNKIIIGLKENR